MALTIVGVQRVSPPPCRHLRITVDEDGAQRTIEADADALLEELRHDRWKVSLVLLWMRYKIASGATPASLAGQTVAT